VNRLVNHRWVLENTIVSGIRSAVYYSTPKHTGHILFPVLGAFVDAIGESRRCWYLYRLASLPPHGLVTMCSSLLGTRRRNRAPLRCRYLYRLASLSPHGLVTICLCLLGTRRRNLAPRRCLSVSTCFSATTRTCNDFFESFRHSSSQSGTPSLFVFVSSSSRSHFACQSLCRVLGVFIAAIGNLVAVGVHKYFFEAAPLRLGQKL
jgi:hypothetical protein